eukprot:288836-Pyramimonas_sp.AAC.1
MMPEPVAQALKRTLRGTNQHRTYPGAETASEDDLPYLEQFVIVKDSWAEKASEVDSSSKTLKANAADVPAD